MIKYCRYAGGRQQLGGEAIMILAIDHSVQRKH